MSNGYETRNVAYVPHPGEESKFLANFRWNNNWIKKEPHIKFILLTMPDLPRKEKATLLIKRKSTTGPQREYRMVPMAE